MKVHIASRNQNKTAEFVKQVHNNAIGDLDRVITRNKELELQIQQLTKNNSRLTLENKTLREKNLKLLSTISFNEHHYQEELKTISEFIKKEGM